MQKSKETNAAEARILLARSVLCLGSRTLRLFEIPDGPVDKFFSFFVKEGYQQAVTEADVPMDDWIVNQVTRGCAIMRSEFARNRPKPLTGDHVPVVLVLIAATNLLAMAGCGSIYEAVIRSDTLRIYTDLAALGLQNDFTENALFALDQVVRRKRALASSLRASFSRASGILTNKDLN